MSSRLFGRRSGVIERETILASSGMLGSFNDIASIDDWWAWTQGALIGTLASGQVRFELVEAHACMSCNVFIRARISRCGITIRYK